MMKMNKWTMALAAAGVVSLSSVAQAQEAAAGADALAASTTLSGYVSTSYTMSDTAGGNIGKTNEDADKFKLDVVSLTLSSAQGAGEYATGYTVGMWIGPDDQQTQTAGGDNFELTEANIDLRLPVGNGLDLKVGQFGTVVGYETYEYDSNAFFQRGLAFNEEPTHHTGVLASYQVSDSLNVHVGAVNNSANNITNDETGAGGGNTWLAAVDYTVGDSAGVLGGTSIYGATIQDSNEADYWYLQVGLPVPVEGLSLDVAADWVDADNGNDDEIYQVYAAYTLSDKATLNARYEFGTADSGGLTDLESVAVGVTYDLWDNVTSRVEWMSTSEEGAADDDTLAFNLVYSF
jgi:hypothetical protein